MSHVGLPEAFRKKMQALLGAEYGEYEDSFQRGPAMGLRFNTWRLEAYGESPAGFSSRVPWRLRPVPWTDNGFYFDEGDRPAKDPYYHAGLYYLQEPSAMAPAACLDVRPGDWVLDLCAAPGGKSTELGSRLRGQGVLVSNDISSSRARALLKNLEMWGIGNAYVTSEGPERLAEAFPETFDRILVDAPCSGEGMFRKDPDMAKHWLERGPEAYLPIQRDILRHAVSMLAPGGRLLYSTCTFDPEEDEGQVEWLIGEDPALELVPLSPIAGSSPGIGLNGCIRLFPHKVEGEGHFMAMVRKKAGSSVERPSSYQSVPKCTSAAVAQEAAELLSHVKMDFQPSRLYRNGDSLYYLPEGLGVRPGIRYLRTGLWLGDVRRGRFEPSQALAMKLSHDTFDQVFSLSHDDERTVRYLKGETIPLCEGDRDLDGWCLVCVDGFPLGFAKGEKGRLKNKYQPGWRWQ